MKSIAAHALLTGAAGTFIHKRLMQPLQTFEGQCQCGAVAYRVRGEAATLFACHCTECQRQSGSAFGMALWIREPVLEITSGQLKEWIRALPSGRHMSCQFCPECGTRLFHSTVGQTKLLSIKPGTLHDTSHLKPVGHLWVRSKQKWLDIEGGTLQYPENPDSFDELLCAWAMQHAETQPPVA